MDRERSLIVRSFACVSAVIACVLTVCLCAIILSEREKRSQPTDINTVTQQEISKIIEFFIDPALK
ncbi:MAG: hypothetical protein IJ766_03530 [Clostridia bacterium]|nr:hypothetical protein [Clostridia bacterium]